MGRYVNGLVSERVLLDYQLHRLGCRRPYQKVRNAWGMNMSFKREAFEKAGNFHWFGFHKGPMAEDNEFSLRVKGRPERKLYMCLM